MAFTVTNTAVTGAVIKSSEQNENFTDVENEINGVTKENAFLIRVGEDLTVGTIASSTAETEIAEVLIPANTVKTGVIIMASGETRGTGDTNSGTVRLRTGTNSSGPSNTERLATTRSHGVGGDDIDMPWSIHWVLTTEETWTGDVYIHITGQNADSSAQNYVTCENLVVIGW